MNDTAIQSATMPMPDAIYTNPIFWAAIVCALLFGAVLTFLLLKKNRSDFDNERSAKAIQEEESRGLAIELSMADDKIQELKGKLDEATKTLAETTEARETDNAASEVKVREHATAAARAIESQQDVARQLDEAMDMLGSSIGDKELAELRELANPRYVRGWSQWTRLKPYLRSKGTLGTINRAISEYNKDVAKFHKDPESQKSWAKQKTPVVKITPLK